MSVEDNRQVCEGIGCKHVEPPMNRRAAIAFPVTMTTTRMRVLHCLMLGGPCDVVLCVCGLI